MAKNKIEIDVKVDDKGTTKKVGLEAKKTSESLDKTAKGALKVDRNIKGTAQASSNASKNFSKMSQGMGGLVGAYATLAAQLFAVSAAFNFLKQAGDLRVLQSGQKAYAASTGLALKTLAKDISEATDAQISFRDASQAAAIGVASGLAPSQLERLGKAARDVSVVLGRDVTDSFNRLVRGVTKAEPELLDELGVILRLKDATEAYATSIGKNANELTAFERSQAVANDVLSQTEGKYSAILEATGSTVNAYNQLGKAFDDILMSIMKVVDTIAGPLAKVLTKTPEAAVAAFGLLLSGPLKALGFNLGDIAQEARRSAAVYKRAASIKAAAAQRVTLSLEEQKLKLKEVAAASVTEGSSSKILQHIGSGGQITAQARATLKRSIEAAKANVNELGQVTKGVFKGMHINMVNEVTTALAKMELAEKNKATGTQKNVARMKAAYVGLVASIKSAGAALATWGTRLLGILGWVGIAVSLFQMLTNSLGLFQEKLSDSEKFAKKNTDRLKEMNKEYESFLEVQKAIILNAETGKVEEAYRGFGAIGQMAGMLDPTQMSKTIKDYKAFSEEKMRIDKKNAEEREIRMATAAAGGTFQLSEANYTEEEQEAAKFINRQIEAIQQMRDEFGVTSKAFDAYEKALTSGASTEEILRAWSAAQEFAATVREYPRLATEAGNALSAWANSMAPLNQAEQTLSAINKEIKAIKIIEEDTGSLTEQQAERLELLTSRYSLIETINERLHKQALDGLELQRDQIKGMRGLTSLLKARKKLEFDLKLNTKQQSDINQQILDLNSQIITQEGEKATPAQQRKLELLQAQLEITREQRVELENQTKETYRLKEAGVQALESSLQTNISALIQGTENSFKDAILNIAKATLTSIADTLSTIMTEKLMGKLFKLDDPAVKMKNAFVEGGTIAAQKIKAAVSGQAISAGSKNLPVLEESTIPKKIPTEGEDKVIVSKKLDSHVKASSLLYDKGEGIKKLGGLFEGFTDKLKGIFSSENPLLQGFSSLFGGLGNMFSSLLSSLGGLFGGGSGGGISSLLGMVTGFFGFANGGYATGGFRAFANGGMVDKPTLGLVGEGKYNEAIVPLPNGKSIPVDMKGAGQNNNVVVNVNVDSQGRGQTTTESQSGADAGNLGQAIARAVQQELQNQKRSGGILNPYGVA